MKRAVLFFVFAFFVACSPGAKAAHTFPDVYATGHWAEFEILQADELGMLSGYPDGLFRPDSAVTNAEFLKMVASAAGMKPEKGCPPDMPELSGHWLSEEGWSVPLKLAGVIEPGLSPDAPLRRLDAAVWAARAACPKCLEKLGDDVELSFSDAESVPKAFRKHLYLVSKKGIIKGYPDGEFRGSSGATRAEAVCIALRLKGSLVSGPAWDGRISGRSFGSPCRARFEVVREDSEVSFSASVTPEGSLFRVEVWDVSVDGKPVEGRREAVVGEDLSGKPWDDIGVHPGSVASALFPRVPLEVLKSLSYGSRLALSSFFFPGPFAPEPVPASLVYQGYHEDFGRRFSVFSADGEVRGMPVSAHFTLDAQALFSPSGGARWGDLECWSWVPLS